MKITFITVAASLLPVFGVFAAHTAISVVGVDFTTNDGWRSTDVPKALDADGDNVYGTDGYLIAQTQDGADSLNPSYASAVVVAGRDPEAVGAGPHQSSFDDVTLAPGPSLSDAVAGDYWLDSGPTGTLDEFFTITLSADAHFRLGVITDQTPPNPPGLLWEAARGVRITGPGGLDTGVVDAMGPGEAWRNADVDYVLFDIEGHAGDVFTVWGEQDERWEANALGGVFFDTVPEPTAPVLGMLGCLSLLLRRRR